MTQNTTETPREFHHPSFRAANTIQDDIFLLAKNHYKAREIDRITAIKLILSVHVVGLEFLKLRDVLHWLLTEFYVKEVVLTTRDQIIDLITNPGSIHRYGPIKPSYEELMIHDIMDRIATKQVYDNGALLMNFEVPKVDPKMQELFDAYRAWELETAEPVAETNDT